MGERLREVLWDAGRASSMVLGGFGGLPSWI